MPEINEQEIAKTLKEKKQVIKSHTRKGSRLKEHSRSKEISNSPVVIKHRSHANMLQKDCSTVQAKSGRKMK